VTRLYWNEKPKYDNQELIGWRLKIAPIIHDMKNLRQNIPLSVNSFIDVPPKHENESHKMLIIFYRAASESPF